jgi:RNA-binding protein 39
VDWPPLPLLQAQLGAGGGLALQAPVAGPCRLSVSNLHVSITENDLRPIFEPFGPLDFVTLQRDPLGRSTGTAFVQ